MPGLEIEKVSYQYEGKGKNSFALKNLTLEIPQGSFLGLIGPNGSGKTTLLRIMSGLLKAQTGNVILDDVDLATLSPKTGAQKIAVISSEPFFEFPFSVYDVVAMGRFPHAGRFAGETAHDREIIQRALESTETTAFKDRSIAELSSGERQRVLLARALAQETPILMLDEPSAHLDIHHEAGVFQFLRRLNREKGVTIIAVLHNLMAAAAFCEKIALLKNGELLKSGRPDEVITKAILNEVYGARIAVHPSPVGGYPQVSYVLE